MAPRPAAVPVYNQFSLLTPRSTDSALPMPVAFTQVQNLIITPLDQPKAFQVFIDDVRLVP